MSTTARAATELVLTDRSNVFLTGFRNRVAAALNWAADLSEQWVVAGRAGRSAGP
jgi:hypothetical protein